MGWFARKKTDTDLRGMEQPGPICCKKALQMQVVLQAALWAAISLPGVQGSMAAPAVSEEYQIKAAFIFNFIKFVDWPQSCFPDQKSPIVIGVVGKDPFGEHLDILARKPVKERSIKIVRFDPIPQQADPVHPRLDQIRTCHVLFISPSEKKGTARLIKALEDNPILTIGDDPDFLQDGGIMNFLIEDNKVRFEVGLAKARSAGLQISSQLLRLAKRVDEGK